MPNANLVLAYPIILMNYIPPVSVGSVTVCVGSDTVCVGSMRLFEYQHIGILNRNSRIGNLNRYEAST